MNKISVRLADWHKDNADIRRIREAVFVAEQHIPPELEFDAEDQDALHFWRWKATTRSAPHACCPMAPSGGSRCSRTGAG